MTLSATEGQTRPSIWPAVSIAFGLLAAVLVARMLLVSAGTPLFSDTDDAMRFAVVRDLLAGQDWFDLLQHRLNTPFGAEMHWSRLVDLPIAGLVLLLRPLAGSGGEILAAWIWPLLLLFGLLALTAMVTVKLVGRDGLLPALVLTAFCIVTLVEFAPGRIDHHSVGILLTLTMLLCVIAALERPGFAFGAGIAAAVALAVAIENLPSVAAAIIGVGVTWVLQPARADALRHFGLGLGAATLATAAATVAPERWQVPACDAFSAVYIAAAGSVGIAFVLLSLLPVKRSGARLALGLTTGAALAAGLALAFPQCLHGPYAALDPWLAERWLSRIREAAPLWDSLSGAPAYVAAAAVPSLLALVVAARRILYAPSAGSSRQWMVYGLFLTFAVAVMLVQVRGVRVAAELAVPAGASLILAARRRYLARGGPVQIAGLVASWTGFAGIAIAAFVGLVVPALAPREGPAPQGAADKQQACLMESAFTRLRALPPARVMTPIDLGAHVLAFTAHEVVAAPYHRNQTGISDSLKFFSLPLEEARAILTERGIGLVVVCPQMPEMRGMADAAEDSFVRLLARGALPDWLVDRGAEGAPISIYEIAPPSGTLAGAVPGASP